MIEHIPEDLRRILTETPGLTETYLVGGCVRDWLLGRENKDYDIEVFGLGFEELVKILSPRGRVDLVGRSFGVVKLTTGPGATYDFTLARRDSKNGPGHTGFKTTFDRALTPDEAAARRDFTINSLMFDPRTLQILDFFGGQKDLDQRILRHTSPAFVEDPLRPLRGMQLAARFDLTATSETIELCRSMKKHFTELPVERVGGEWFKWAAKSKTPSLGLKFLNEIEWIEPFPELANLRGVEQEPDYHPEGDVFTHTCHCCDALAKLPKYRRASEEVRTVLMLATLTHDFGKPSTTTRQVKHGRERITSYGHEEAGGPIAESFLKRIYTPPALIDRILPLVMNHMVHYGEVSPRSIRRLANRLRPETIETLAIVIEADQRGRPPKKANLQTLRKLQKKARQMSLESHAPQPVLLGRHLLELGLQSGPEMGKLLKEAFEAQLNGDFTDLNGALAWVGTHSKSSSL